MVYARCVTKREEGSVESMPGTCARVKNKCHGIILNPVHFLLNPVHLFTEPGPLFAEPGPLVEPVHFLSAVTKMKFISHAKGESDHQSGFDDTAIFKRQQHSDHKFSFERKKLQITHAKVILILS
jgi:hypothetical protein